MSQPVVVDGRTVIPAGTRFTGHVTVADAVAIHPPHQSMRPSFLLLGTCIGALGACAHPSPTLEVEFIPVAYDHERLAREMREEQLPEEFVQTVLAGWWTTCLEVLPAKERRRGKW